MFKSWFFSGQKLEILRVQKVLSSAHLMCKKYDSQWGIYRHKTNKQYFSFDICLILILDAYFFPPTIICGMVSLIITTVLSFLTLNVIETHQDPQYVKYLFNETRYLNDIYPYMALITNYWHRKSHCTGSVFSKIRVLTSRRCVIHGYHLDQQLYVAKFDLFAYQDYIYADMHEIVHQYGAPLYSIYGDIWVVEVEPPFAHERKIIPVVSVVISAWNEFVKSKKDVVCRILGFGQMKYNNSNKDEDQESYFVNLDGPMSLTYVEVTPMEKCKEALPGEVCVQHIDNRSDNYVCDNHWGGPLVCDGIKRVIGIYSRLPDDIHCNINRPIRITLIGNDNPVIARPVPGNPLVNIGKIGPEGINSIQIKLAYLLFLTIKYISNIVYSSVFVLLYLINYVLIYTSILEILL